MNPYRLLFFSCYIALRTVVGVQANADPIRWNLAAYKAQPGLTATVRADTLLLAWAGGVNADYRAYFVVDQGTPKLARLAVRKQGGNWKRLATQLTPEYRVASAIRRVTQQQTEPLEKLGIPLTERTLNAIKWDAFWDAPLLTGNVPPLSHKTAIPAFARFANHPGMPRLASEIKRVTATYQVTEGAVRTNGARMEIRFDGVQAGIFSGYLQYDIFRGSGLIRQTLMAKTEDPSVAFKFDAGLSGMPRHQSTRLLWRDLGRHWQQVRFGTPPDKAPVTVKSSNRLIAVETEAGSMAVFPPPHSFFWARETEQNLGYSWYRTDSAQTFSLGIRQADYEEDPHFSHNFALYSARPGTWQRMPMFILLSPDSGEQVIEQALAYTHHDFFKPLPGYKVMGYHYHVGLVKRFTDAGGSGRINDIEAIKSVGINLFGVIDGVRGEARNAVDDSFLEAQATYYQTARLHSDKDFLLMPHDENSTDGRSYELGGHHDLLLSKPVFWRNTRKPGQPLVEQHPKYGPVYNLGSPADLMAMTERENALISMPHPRTKGSTGYPDAIKDTPHFLHERYFGLGYRWGMGIDASESRLGEYRFIALWDEVNNWMTARNRPLKHVMAISETRSDYGERGKPPYDDIYGMSPVNYVKIDRVPTVDDMSPVIKALKEGAFFVTSGEVLITSFALTGTGEQRRLTADVEWTFPLDFVEVVWGDGVQTHRNVIPTTDLPPFGKKRFTIPFDPTGKKWVRFAAWDVATNGAMGQPQRLEPDPTTRQ
ncbi:hypothetical protein BN8_02469 [Fibrisoma limi BUZ 3]|uniref:Uncharacterized protein n=1 Tax=Fibrisoma limi BUZ 3 TaxID=1185876 RepID=I2GHK2_9BACT|nr:hypothetical protein [Fibrisoma limi]CCH53377.1 hypothetical protein BN8_02469 [Fibrisoma limi BUZ 3]